MSEFPSLGLANRIGYLAPDGTHHPCEAWAHRALAQRLTGIEPRTLLSLEDVFDDLAARDAQQQPLDAEQTLDREGYVRIHSNNPNTDMSVSWVARFYDPDARLTEPQVNWLRSHGYGRHVRSLCEQTFTREVSGE